jgi:hypothetical protein
MKNTFSTLFGLCAILSSSLAQEKAPEAPAAPAAAPKAAKASLKAGEYTLTADEKWTAKAEPRMMSAGGFAWMKDGKPLLDADVYYFGEGQGGNVESNIKRWEGQFQAGADGAGPKAVRTLLKYGEAKASLIEIKGTFLSGSMFGPKTGKEGQVMLGAILESAKGSVFVKMVGPAADIETARDGFRKLLDSAYPVPGVEVKPEAATETK